MSVTAQTPYNSYSYVGSSTFVYGFLVPSSSDLLVTVDGVQKTLGVDYTISGVGDPSGGSITYTSALTIGQQVILRRSTVRTRTTDYQNNGDLQASQLNSDLDRLWMVIQELDTLGLISGDASALALNLSNTTDKTKGAKLVGFSAGLTSETGTDVFTMLAQSTSVVQFCKGDGTDETTKMQAAMATGKKLYVPADFTVKVSDELTFSAAGQLVWGFGTIQQTANNKRIFVGLSKTGVGVKGLTLKPSPAYTASNRVDAVSLSACDRFIFQDNTIDWTGCTSAQNGLRAINCNYGKVSGNWFLNAPNTNGVYQTINGGDIVFEESSSYNHVQGNWCISGSVYGINITTSTAAGTTRGNKIIGNTVKNCTGYGIILYRGSGGVTADFGGNEIIGNNIENITGGVLSVNDGTSRWFGAGIYDQDARDTLIQGNTVFNVAQQTNAGSLPIAGISATHVTATIVGNTVNTSGKLGFYISSDNASGVDPAPANAVLTLNGNKALNCTSESFKVYNARRLNASGNSAHTSNSGSAFTVDTNGDWKTHVVVSGLILDTVQGGISINNATIVSLQNAHVNATSSTGVSVSNTDYLDMGGGSSVKSVTGNGLSIASTVGGGVLDDILLVSETGYGAVMDGNLKIGRQVVFGTTGSGRWTGSYGGDTRTLDNTGTPSVKNGSDFETGGTTAITAFTGGEASQTFVLRSNHNVTLTNGANLVLKGGVNANLVGGNIISFRCRSTGAWEEVSRNF